MNYGYLRECPCLSEICTKDLRAKEYHVYSLLQMVQKTMSHTHIYWERRIKHIWLNVHIWGIWVKGIWEFFTVFSQLFCKSEIMPKYKVRGERGKKFYYQSNKIFIKEISRIKKNIKKKTMSSLHLTNLGKSWFTFGLLSVSYLWGMFLTLRWAFKF